MNDSYKNEVSNTASTNAYTYINPAYCGYRLPCGWCKELNRMCPNTSMQITTLGDTPTINFNEVTC